MLASLEEAKRADAEELGLGDDDDVWKWRRTSAAHAEGLAPPDGGDVAAAAHRHFQTAAHKVIDSGRHVTAKVHAWGEEGSGDGAAGGDSKAGDGDDGGGGGGGGGERRGSGGYYDAPFDAEQSSRSVLKVGRCRDDLEMTPRRVRSRASFHQ